MKYILASKSPRRKELMKQISPDFIVAVEDIDEEKYYQLPPIDAVRNIAKEKGKVVDKSYPDDLVISADTIVVLDGKIIGKPKDELDAKNILRLLSNKTHNVYTAYRIQYKGMEILHYVDSKVIFNNLSEDLIENYVKSGSPLDKAGAYGVQDNKDFPLIKKVIGSIDNVIGFPVAEIKEDISNLLLAVEN